MVINIFIFIKEIEHSFYGFTGARSQVALSHRIYEMTWQTNQRMKERLGVGHEIHRAKPRKNLTCAEKAQER